MTLARSLVALFVAAVAASLVAAREDRLPGDLWLLRRMQDFPGWFEPFAEAARSITTTQVVIPLGLLLAVTLFFRRRRPLAEAALVAFVALPLVQAGIKNVVDRPRPDAGLVDRRATFTSESFPSGHTMSGTLLVLFVCAAALVTLPPNWQRYASMAVAVLVVLVSVAGDMYLGVHWPSDVVGGILWAAALFCAALLGARYAARWFGGR